MFSEKYSFVWRYGVAIVTVALALWLTLLLRPLLDPVVFALFFAAVMVSAWYGGLGSGLLATVFAMLVIDGLFLSPPGTLALSLESFVQLGVFVLVALLISSLTAARRRAEEALRRAHDELELRVQERTADLAKANAALHAEISERKRAEETQDRLLHDLNERVKELTLLHHTAQLLQNGQKSTGEVLQEITTLLPAAWQYPELAEARICFEDGQYTTPHFSLTPWIQRAVFTTVGGQHGVVEIVYAEDRANNGENPFLAEENSLLNTLAEMVQAYVERQEAERRVADITRELAERNRELLRLEREMGRVAPLAALGRITGTIAHELGTPLNSVLGYSQLLAEEGLSASARESVQIIEAQAQRMRDMIQHYLSQTRDTPPKRIPTNLNTLVAETLLLLKPVFQQQKVEVKTTLEETLPSLHADRASLQRVLINVLNNAVDAMEAGGRVTVSTRVSSPPETTRPGIVVEVMDTGAGIPADALPSIFELFATTKMPGKGTGLGLVICQQIVKAHGGTIELTSQVGKGTCVSIFLPIEERRASTAFAKEKR